MSAEFLVTGSAPETFEGCDASAAEPALGIQPRHCKTKCVAAFLLLLLEL
jgi:hypothetical protein